jgi:hypothetical protein
MILFAALLLAASPTLAAEMPKDFQGTWCTNSGDDLKDWAASNTQDADCGESNDFSPVEITATVVKSPALSLSCVVREVTKFDVCPWGMIFRNRERARVLRPFQINPWSPGYHIMLQCTDKTIETDWALEKGGIITVSRDYRCPWERAASAKPQHVNTCKGILRQDQNGLTIDVPPEGLCEINGAQAKKVLATCTVGQFCRVTGIEESCKDSGECSEITRVLSVGRR